MKKFSVAPLLFAIVALGALASVAKAQSVAGAGSSFSDASSSPPFPTPPKRSRSRVPSYMRPTEKTKLRNYLFDTFGPYPIAGAAILGGRRSGRQRHLRSGDRAREPTASELGPTSASRW